MDKADKIIIFDKITADIKAMEKQIRALEEKAKIMPQDCSLCDLSRSEAMIEIETTNKILKESRLRLEKLKNALKKIDSPDFGICVECENPIAIERMKIRPESIRCVKCENERSKTN